MVSNTRDSDGFIATISSESVKPGRITLIEIGDQRVILTRVEGELYAFNATCPHALGNLGGGFIHNGEIECPVHGWRFNIRTGLAAWPEEEALKLTRHVVKEEGGRVKLKLTPRPGFRPQR